MRRVKATVYLTKEGKVGEARTKDALFQDEGESYAADTVPGHILVPLKKGRSRQKGNEHELEVAKAFSRWLYGDPLVLRRTPLSGGWGAGKMGDVTMDPIKAQELKLKRPPLYIECRNYDGVLDCSFWRWLSTGSPATITAWIKEVIKKAGEDYGFLVIKDKNVDPWVMFLGWQPGHEWNDDLVVSFRTPVDRRVLFFPLRDIKQVFREASVRKFKGE